MNPQNKLVVAISSRALFDVTESHLVFEQDSVEAYISDTKNYQGVACAHSLNLN